MVRMKIVSALTTALLAGALPVLQVAAQSPEVQAARDQVERSTGQLSTPQAPTPAEIAARKATLVDILDLTKAELADLMSEQKLGSVSISDNPALVALAAELFPRLRLSQQYVQLIAEQTERVDIDADELVQIAADFKTWREEVYDPLVKQVFSVLLVNQGAGVLATAQRRLERVTTDVKRLQLTLGAEANVLLGYVGDAKEHLTDAAKYHQRAYELVFSNQAAVFSADESDVPGASRVAHFDRGVNGSFDCFARDRQRSTACDIVFKSATGGYYLLLTEQGLTLNYALSDIYRVTGRLVTLNPLFGTDQVRGVMLITEINPADPQAAAERAAHPVVTKPVVPTLASVADTLISAPTVQSLIRQELEAISQAYKNFIALSRQAKKLLAQ